MATDENLLGEVARTNRSPLLWVLALTGCVLGGASLVQHEFFANDRFYLVQEKDGAATEIDRRTGRTWRIYRGRKWEIKSPDDAVLLQPSLHDQIAGKVVQEDYRGLWVDFYNGTKWTIGEVTIRVPNTPDGRLFRHAQTIGPHTTGRIIFDIDRKNVGQSGWSLAEVRGYPPDRP